MHFWSIFLINDLLMKLRFNLYLILLAFTSCISLQPITFENENLSSTNYHLLNGKYQNQANDSVYSGLAWYLFQYNSKASKTPEAIIDRVEIEMIDSLSMKISIFSEENLIKSVVRKGKFKNGYFEFKTHVKFETFYLLLNSVLDMKTRLTLTEDNNLYVDQKDGGCVYIIIAPGMCVGGSNYGIIFDKIEDND